MTPSSSIETQTQSTTPLVPPSVPSASRDPSSLQAWELINAGELAEAEGVLWNRLSELETTRGLAHQDLAPTLNDLAYVFFLKTLDSSSTSEAKELAVFQGQSILKRALAIQRSALGSKHPHVAETLSRLATFHQAGGNFEEAIRSYLQALEIFRETEGADSSAIAIGLNNLALVYWDKGDLREAERVLAEAVSIQSRALGAEHPSTLGMKQALQDLQSDIHQIN